MLHFSSEQALCIDTGANCCIINKKADFTTYSPTESCILHGILSGLQIAGTGTLRWTITDNNGHDITMYLHNSLHVPDTPVCLLSPQHMAQQTTSDLDSLNSQCGSSILTFFSFKCTMYYNFSNNLPVIFLLHDFNPTTYLVSNTSPTSPLSSTDDSSDQDTN